MKKIGGDQGYSGNDNRTFCKENRIETSFTQKVRTGKNEVKNATKRELARVRATAMAGSSGTQIEHYGLRKIAARIKSTEIMLIFFGIHTANVVNLARCKTRVSTSSSCCLIFYAWNTALREWWIQT